MISLKIDLCVPLCKTSTSFGYFFKKDGDFVLKLEKKLVKFKFLGFYYRQNERIIDFKPDFMSCDEIFDIFQADYDLYVKFLDQHLYTLVYLCTGDF